jgi:hypothetical protein
MSLSEDEDKFLHSVKAQLNESLRAPWPDISEFKPVNILVDEVMTRYQRRVWLRQAVIVSAGCVGGLIGLSQFFRARAFEQTPQLISTDMAIEAKSNSVVSGSDHIMTLIIERVAEFSNIFINFSQSNSLIWLSLALSLGLIAMALIRPIDEW